MNWGGLRYCSADMAASLGIFGNWHRLLVESRELCRVRSLVEEPASGKYTFFSVSSVAADWDLCDVPYDKLQRME